MTESHDNTTCRRATTTDPAVQAVAEVLGCKRVTDRNGTAYCAEHNFGWLRDVSACPRAERAAEVVLAAARPAIEREAMTEAWGEGYREGILARHADEPTPNPYKEADDDRD